MPIFAEVEMGREKEAEGWEMAVVILDDYESVKEQIGKKQMLFIGSSDVIVFSAKQVFEVLFNSLFTSALLNEKLKSKRKTA